MNSPEQAPQTPPSASPEARTLEMGPSPALTPDEQIQYELNQNIPPGPQINIGDPNVRLDPAKSQEIEVMDREVVRMAGIAAVHAYTGRLEKLHAPQLDAAGEALEKAIKSKKEAGVIPEDTPLKAVLQNPEYQKVVENELKEFKAISDYDPASTYAENLDNEEFGINVDPWAVRDNPHGMQGRVARFRAKVQAAREEKEEEERKKTEEEAKNARKDSGETGEEESKKEVPQHIEAAIAGEFPKKLPDNKQRRQMQKIGDAKRRQTHAGIKAAKTAMFAGSIDLRGNGPNTIPLPPPDPVEDAENLWSVEALEAASIDRYGQGKNIFGEVINHQLGSEVRPSISRRVERSEAKEARAMESHLGTDEVVKRRNAFPAREQVLEAKADRIYRRNLKKIEDYNEEFEDIKNGMHPLRVRARRIGRTFKRYRDIK